MNAPFWMKYIGLPYRLGADPESGEATDCIRLVLRVLEGAGLTPPPVERNWYNHLAKREIQPIMEDWYALTEQTSGPENYAMTILPGEGDFAIAIVVQGGVIAVRTSTGSIWIPLENLIPLNFRRLRHA